MKNLSRLNLVACGSAFFAAQLGVRYIRSLSSVRVEAFRASEFDEKSMAGPGSLTIGITQSGETKDTLDALTRAKVSGGHVSSICNAIESTISRFTGNRAYLQGPGTPLPHGIANMSAVLILLAITISDSTLR